MALYNSTIELIGNTPLLRLNNIEKLFNLNAKLYAKLEMFNPAGSIKDRAALFMVKNAIEKGLIKEGDTIIEPTSGNTGIGLALVCKQYKLNLILTMPDSMSEERRTLLKARGAKLVLTPGKDGMSGACEEAKRIQSTIPNSIIANQFNNPSNALAHEKTTALELLEDLDNKVDYVVAGVGSAGTIVGLSKKLKEINPNTVAVAVEPLESPLLSKNISGPHKIQGIGANFIPENYKKELIDEIILVASEDAINTTTLLNNEEQILAGISSGANLWAGIEIAKRDEAKGKNIVVIIPDTGEHYLSLGIYQ